MAVAPHTLTLRSKGQHNAVKMAFHDADTDTNILARKYRVGRKIVAVLGESVSASWNASLSCDEESNVCAVFCSNSPVIIQVCYTVVYIYSGTE